MRNDHDKDLNIETETYIEWPLLSNLNYNRTESTDYEVLDYLMDNYLRDNLKEGRLVDFGSGKGRVLFYLYSEMNSIKMLGIEYNQNAFAELEQNLDNFYIDHPNAKKDIMLKKTKAEDYYVQPQDTTFYFFNPFTVRIFKKVVKNILDSLNEIPRKVDIILYYPNRTYREFLELHTPFEEVKRIKMPMYVKDKTEYVVIYQNK